MVFSISFDVHFSTGSYTGGDGKGDKALPKSSAAACHGLGHVFLFLFFFFPFIATLLPVQAAALSRSEMGALAASRHYMLGGTSPA